MPPKGSLGRDIGRAQIFLPQISGTEAAQHRARLDEQPTQFAPETMAREQAAVLALWQAVFGAAS